MTSDLLRPNDLRNGHVLLHRLAQEWDGWAEWSVEFRDYARPTPLQYTLLQERHAPSVPSRTLAGACS
jgi:hypothetical protein